MSTYTKYIPILLFVATAAFVAKGISLSPKYQNSAMVGQTIPDFSLPTLHGDKSFSDTDLIGDVVLLNVWATWCDYCEYEHPNLMKLADNSDIKLYGLNYKDQKSAAKSYLKSYENPYVETLFDQDGALGAALDVYGAPETFVIDHKGIIRARITGVLTQSVWQNEVAPLVAKLKAEQQQTVNQGS